MGHTLIAAPIDAHEFPFARQKAALVGLTKKPTFATHALLNAIFRGPKDTAGASYGQLKAQVSLRPMSRLPC